MLVVMYLSSVLMIHSALRSGEILDRQAAEARHGAGVHREQLHTHHRPHARHLLGLCQGEHPLFPFAFSIPRPDGGKTSTRLNRSPLLGTTPFARAPVVLRLAPRARFDCMVARLMNNSDNNLTPLFCNLCSWERLLSTGIEVYAVRHVSLIAVCTCRWMCGRKSGQHPSSFTF